MVSIRRALVVMLAVLTACGPGMEEGFDPVTGEGIGKAQQSLVVDDLYNKLREVEGLLTQPLPTQEIVVGTLDASNGTFSGLTTTYRIDPITHKPRAMTPFASIDAIEAIAVFNVINGSGITVTANGRTATGTNQVKVNVGIDSTVDWTLQAGGWSRGDKFIVTRPGVIGAGAFTVAALPISIVYEPPMNAARTNSATIGFRQEMTTITTVSKGSGSTAKPEWATGIVMKDILDRLSKHWKPAAAVKTALSVSKTLLGSVDSSTTTGTTVNSDSTLGLTQVSAQNITTNAKLGPGLGDIIVFYKDARVVWAMEEGKVSLMLVDHGPLAMLSVATLRSDLFSARAGTGAPVTGLDVPTLEALIRLDPLASTSALSTVNTGSVALGGVLLRSPRFKKDTTLILSGSTFSNSISHTVTQTDKTSTMNTTTTVKNYHPGWLSLIGVGVTQAGTFTTTVSLGTSRTDAVSSTVSAGFTLSAAAGESYTVDVNYDNIFGSFLTRFPPPPPPVICCVISG